MTSASKLQAGIIVQSMWLSVRTDVATFILMLMTNHATGDVPVLPYSLDHAVDSAFGDVVLLSEPITFDLQGHSSVGQIRQPSRPLSARTSRRRILDSSRNSLTSTNTTRHTAMVALARGYKTVLAGHGQAANQVPLFYQKPPATSPRAAG
jgi:hypothetical protein